MHYAIISLRFAILFTRRLVICFPIYKKLFFFFFRNVLINFISYYTVPSGQRSLVFAVSTVTGKGPSSFYQWKSLVHDTKFIKSASQRTKYEIFVERVQKSALYSNKRKRERERESKRKKYLKFKYKIFII